MYCVASASQPAGSAGAMRRMPSSSWTTDSSMASATLADCSIYGSSPGLLPKADRPLTKAWYF